MTVLHNRWRTGRHVGSAKPTQQVQVQKGFFKRGYRAFVKLDGSTEEFGEISKNKHNRKPWQAWWVARSDWITVPNVAQVTLEEALNEEGMADPETSTVEIENIIYKDVTGPAGVFRQIKEGYMGWSYGYTVKGRKFDKATEGNQWTDVFASGYRIRIRQGYGDAQEVTFMGFIDEVDTDSLPRHITLTCRNSGCLLTDQRVAGKVKAREIPGPVIFADRKRSLNITHVGGNARASSHISGHEPFHVTREPGTTYADDWMSEGWHEDQRDDHTEWVEIEIPGGDYDRFYLHPKIAGNECWVSLYAKSGPNTACSYDGVQVPDGWVDLGIGTVPGTERGGFPFVAHYKRLDHNGHWHKIKRFHCHSGSKLRVAFRHLGYSEKHGHYHAAVKRLTAERKVKKQEAKDNHWILVDDAADVVKWALMWAGFHEWEVQDFGVRIKNPMTFHQSDFLSTIVQHMVEQGDFIFHVNPPTEHEDSIGVPVFRRSRALKKSNHVEEVRSTNLLTQVQHKFSKEPLAWVIRTRGKPSISKGQSLFEDRIKRYMATYWPPWSGRHTRIASRAKNAPHPLRAGRLSGIIKHVTHFDHLLSNNDECMMMCVLIALQEALAAWRGTISIPGYPGFYLDDQISIVDTPSGLNSRMWIAHRSSTFVSGRDTSWTMTLEGAMIDSPMIANVTDDYNAILKRVKNEYTSEQARSEIGTAVYAHS